jgi:hypothetical protein
MDLSSILSSISENNTNQPELKLQMEKARYMIYILDANLPHGRPKDQVQGTFNSKIVNPGAWYTEQFLRRAL